MESETENENTNPPGQDGDSNFVSNDSTSQEQIIDENTTQTTATTTTEEDGEENTVNTTPLASDSESNIEPPPPPRHINMVYTNNNSNNIKVLKEATNNNKNREISKKSNTLTSTVAANGNGLLPLGLESGAVEGVEAVTATVLDNNSSSCLRESEYEDESSNSNSINNNQVPLNSTDNVAPTASVRLTPPPFVNHQSTDVTESSTGTGTSITINDNNSTNTAAIDESKVESAATVVSSSPAAAIKRHLNCSTAEEEGLSQAVNSDIDAKRNELDGPEVKKARNE